MVVLVVPIDESAPKGRLILPQQRLLGAVRSWYGGGGYQGIHSGHLEKFKSKAQTGYYRLESLNRYPKMFPGYSPTSFFILFAQV